MAVTEQRNLFNPEIESLAGQYAKQMGIQGAKPFQPADIAAMAPQVAPQTYLQGQATDLTKAGLGAYAPYVTQAGADVTAAGQQLGTAVSGLGAIQAGYIDPAKAGVAGAGTTLGGVSQYITDAATGLGGAGTTLGTAGTQLTGAQTAMGGVSPYITGAGAAGVAPGATAMGAQAYTGLGQAAGLQGPMTGQQLTDYMSPYQQQVIDTSLAEFDRQAAMRQQGISDAAVGLGGYGGGREGVMQAEYQTQSDRNRAMLQAGLQQQGFTQAQGARQQDYLNRLGLAQAQQGLGSYQAGLGSATQQQLGADIGMAGQVGSANQAQAQAELDAIREANRLAAYEPLERLGMYGTGVTGLMGGYPSQYQFTSQPGPTPLQSALGIASVGGGLYGNIYGPQRPKFK